MTNKTALQQLIEWQKENKIEVILNTDVIIQKAIELLEVEQNQLSEAYESGWREAEACISKEIHKYQ